MRIPGVRASAWLLFLCTIGACGGDDAKAVDAAPNGPLVDAAPIDAPVPADAAPPDAIGLGQVQCRVANDCIVLVNDGCFQSKPGGVCANCMEPTDHCPAGATCITGGNAGASECAYPCTDDGQCNLGLRCSTSGPTQGYCQPRPCGPNEPPCPTPYTFCRFGECARPLCSAGCTPPLVCADPGGGGFCVEP